MDSDEWYSCIGEVFTIYRRGGPGVVRVGDDIGLHISSCSGDTWLGCFSAICINRATCPGTPNPQTGFQDEFRWIRCPGEVFKIYAGGKPVGAPIGEFDRVILYYARDDNYIGMPFGILQHYTCPGHWGRPIPHNNAYEHCSREVFEIVKMK